MLCCKYLKSVNVCQESLGRRFDLYATKVSKQKRIALISYDNKKMEILSLRYTCYCGTEFLGILKKILTKFLQITDIKLYIENL